MLGEIMEFIYNYNGLPIYTQQDILTKDYLTKLIIENIKSILSNENQAWKYYQIESGSLIPRSLVNSNYTEDDVYFINSDLALKPETTSASYEYAINLLNHQTMLPISVFQCSRSYRKEQDQATKHCRFKEFNQLEFQCLFSSDTKNDYQEKVLLPIAHLFSKVLGLPTRIVLSDRLPSYSLKTIDIEVNNGDKWMEISSISLRNDFPIKPIIKNKSIDVLNLEIAIGIDRLLYNYMLQSDVTDARE